MNKYQNKNSAFTLSELMVVLVVLSVIASLTIPNIIQRSSDVKPALYKSAVKFMGKTVYELIMDSELYDTSEGKLSIDKNGATASSSYFCDNITNLANTISDFDCSNINSNPTADPTSPDMITTNGMAWWGLNHTFTSTSDATIYVDLDGLSKGNNLAGSDVFKIIIKEEGKVTAPGDSSDITPELCYLLGDDDDDSDDDYDCSAY